MSAEHDRQIGTLAMIGVIKELDETEAVARVEVDGLLTDWLPWTVARSGAGLRTWAAPEVGEQVLIVCPYGDPAQGVIVGSLYQSAHAAPASAKETVRAEFADGTVVQYDRATGELLIDVGTGKVTINCDTATVTAATSVKLDSPKVECTGDVEVSGKVTAHGDVESTGGDVKAGSITLKTHKHTGVQSGGSMTGTPV